MKHFEGGDYVAPPPAPAPAYNYPTDANPLISNGLLNQGAYTGNLIPKSLMNQLQTVYGGGDSGNGATGMSDPNGALAGYYTKITGDPNGSVGSAYNVTLYDAAGKPVNSEQQTVQPTDPNHGFFGGLLDNIKQSGPGIAAVLGTAFGLPALVSGLGGAAAAGSAAADFGPGAAAGWGGAGAGGATAADLYGSSGILSGLAPAAETAAPAASYVPTSADLAAIYGPEGYGAPLYAAPTNAALIESAVGTPGYGASSAGAGGPAALPWTTPSMPSLPNIPKPITNAITKALIGTASGAQSPAAGSGSNTGTNMGYAQPTDYIFNGPGFDVNAWQKMMGPQAQQGNGMQALIALLSQPKG